MNPEYQVRIPKEEYWREQIRCQAACPVHTDARGYVRAIAEGRDELAYLIARGPNPLASICGRVCGAPCEAACRRGDYDEPVSIRRLKQFVCEQFGSEAALENRSSMTEYIKECAKKYAPHACQDQEELLPLLQSLMQGSVKKAQGKSVGIVGSGPAGLAAAHDLALLGFDVTIYEMEPVLAGMLAVGIPEYRLPRRVIQAEVDVILSLGVKAVTNCCVGKDITLPELRQKHDAVVIAVGAKRSRKIPIPGADANGVIGGVEFLRDVSLGTPSPLGERVVVIGGGNVAYDVGRTVLRQISMDAARTAKREEGVHEVYLCSLESLEEMPADDMEIIEGDEEGIIRKNSLGPSEILVDERGNVRGVRFKKCLRVFDENRRFSPMFDENDITEILCDTVLIAIGQSYDLSFIDPERDGLNLLKNGAIACDASTGKTDAADVFVAGDLAYGTKLLIHAVASGKSTARTIYQHYTQQEITFRETQVHFPVTHYYREQDYEKRARISPHISPSHERVMSQNRLVEHVYTEEEARCEAARCLNCGINTIFDGERCILCGGCVDVCPQRCLSLVSLDLIAGQPEVKELLPGLLGDDPLNEASAMLKDETICIRCGLCAERCPADAISMEEFCYEVKPSCLAV